MQQDDLVSVVLPNHDRARSIVRAIRGVLAQTHRNLELIVVDDASTDNSVALIEAEAARDPRVRLIRHPANRGAAAARTTGIEAARGDLIAFQDSDDQWLPDKLEVQTHALAGFPADCVAVFGPEIIYGRDGEGSRKRYGPRRAACVPGPGVRIESGDLSAAFARGNLMTLQTVLLRKAAFFAAGGFDPLLRNNEDWDFNIRLSRLGPIGYLDAPLVVVFDSPDGISKNRRASLASQVRIFRKLRRAGVAPATLAAQAVAVGRLLSYEDRHRAARRHFAFALAQAPRRPAIWVRWVTSFHPTAARLISWRQRRRWRSGPVRS